MAKDYKREDILYPDQKIIQSELVHEMQTSYIEYAMSVIVGRALPDVRDGLKPVHRRILYAMYEDNLTSDKPFKKSATCVGDVLGRYHPHGDASVYDAMVRLAQDFSMRYMLVDGHGNFGSVDGDPPAAYRYTEARMSKMACEMLTDIEKDTIDWDPNFDETKKELATEEMVVTGNLADSVGKNDATTVINQAKMQVIADNVQNADDIYNIVVNISNNNNVTLTDDEINTIVNLLQQISQQDYDYSEMQETLERVNDNVTGKAEESSDSSDDEDSIVDNVDQSALGDNVIESSTEDPGLAEETGAADESADGDISEVGGTDTGDGSDSSAEITDISQLNTDFLGDDAKAKFEKAKTFCQGEYSGDEDALYEVMGDDAAVTVTLDSDTANKLSIKVLQKYLGILGNGAVSYQEDGTEKYITPELNMLDKEMKKLFGIDVIDDGESSEDIDVLGDAVSSDDKDTLYKDTMKFFEKLYGESSESSDSADGSENVTTDESATDEVGDESYDETIDEESYEE